MARVAISAKRESEVTLQARDARFLRAAQEVLKNYNILGTGKPGRDGLLEFEVTGGSAPYLVKAHPGWEQPPTCTCPDAERRAREHNAGYCKHIIAVLLGEDALRCQLLELFL